MHFVKDLSITSCNAIIYFSDFMSNPLSHISRRCYIPVINMCNINVPICLYTDMFQYALTTRRHSVTYLTENEDWGSLNSHTLRRFKPSSIKPVYSPLCSSNHFSNFGNNWYEVYSSGISVKCSYKFTKYCHLHV